MTNYIEKLTKVLNGISKKQVSDLIELIQQSSNIYVFGNGGSFSVADHFLIDLIKFGNKRAYTLNSPAMLTMISNDYGFEHGFHWFLTKYSGENDLIIGITTSGKSNNVLRVLSGKVGVKTALITGLGGKEIAKEFDTSIVVNSTHTQILEDTFGILCHCIALKLQKGSKNVN